MAALSVSKARVESGVQSIRFDGTYGIKRRCKGAAMIE